MINKKIKLFSAGVGKKERVESNPHSKIEAIMSGH
jgi:hypothetical protein